MQRNHKPAVFEENVLGTRACTACLTVPPLTALAVYARWVLFLETVVGFEVFEVLGNPWCVMRGVGVVQWVFGKNCYQAMIV